MQMIELKRHQNKYNIYVDFSDFILYRRELIIIFSFEVINKRIYGRSESSLFVSNLEHIIPNYIGKQLIMQQGNLSAKAWVLMDAKSQAYLRGCNTQDKRQIASITKMYTLYACLTLNKFLGVLPECVYLEIMPNSVTGTLANLIPAEFISILDLYYALMLPSGNDAACILAFYYGGWLVSKKTFLGHQKSTKKQNLGDKMKYYQLYIKKFVQFMNNFIVKQELHHTNTHFQNCHGLPDKNQVSTVWELAEASLKFLKNPLFSQICSCKVYRGNYYQSDFSFEWQNTNILLKQGFKGIKTGYTTTAGGCLSSLASIQISKYEKQQLLIIILGCRDSQSRFAQTKMIIQDYKKYLRMMDL